MSAWTVPSYGDDWAVPGYTEERELGRGASGKVVEAINDLTGQRVAIKYLSPTLVRDTAFMWGFRTEAQMLRSLGVPQVVQVYDYVEEPGQGAAIVMELVDGVSLYEMIVRRGPTGPEAALVVLKGSLLGLAAAHTLGIVHRDFKPENILVDTAGNSKLADFGVAVKAGKQAPAAGTPLYMAPEQWQGAPASPATDVYAATAVFFECLTGKTPFSGKLHQLQEQHVTAAVPVDRVDAPLQGLIARGMAKNPAGRPQSAIAFVAELEAAAGATFGPDWEERGQHHLAERTAALLALLLRNGGSPGSSGTSYASTWLGGGGRGGRRGGRRGDCGHAEGAEPPGEPEQLVPGGRDHPVVQGGGQCDPAGGGVKVHHADLVRLHRHAHGHRAGDSEVPVGVLVGQARAGADHELHGRGEQDGERRDRQDQEGRQRLGGAQDTQPHRADLEQGQLQAPVRSFRYRPDQRVGVRSGAFGHRHVPGDAAEPHRHRRDHEREEGDGLVLLGTVRRRELGPRDPYLHRARHDGGGAAGDRAAGRSRQR